MKANQKAKLCFVEDKRGFIDTGVIAAIVGGFIVLMIGAVIFWNVYNSMTFPEGANMSGLTDMFNTVWGLLPIVMLVGAAGLIIATITGAVGVRRRE